MHDLDAIETINFEQLATATDRLLLHRGQVPKHRPSATELAPDHTIVIRPSRRSFDSTTILVSSVATAMFFAFATIAALF
jgi:hypothetical protein